MGVLHSILIFELFDNLTWSCEDSEDLFDSLLYSDESYSYPVLLLETRKG